MVTTLCFHCCGSGFDPWSGNHGPTSHAVLSERKKGGREERKEGRESRSNRKTESGRLVIVQVFAPYKVFEGISKRSGRPPLRSRHLSDCPHPLCHPSSRWIFPKLLRELWITPFKALVDSLWKKVLAKSHIVASTRSPFELVKIKRINLFKGYHRALRGTSKLLSLPGG